MLQQTRRRTLATFLQHELSRVGAKTAADILASAGRRLRPDTDPHRVTANEAAELLCALGRARVSAPDTTAVVPIAPQDIVDFDLQDATHPLTATDIKRAEDALGHDPFFGAHPRWRAALEQMLSMGVRAEQQALAEWGLNHVIEHYLPTKLARSDAFLP